MVRSLSEHRVGVGEGHVVEDVAIAANRVVLVWHLRCLLERQLSCSWSYGIEVVAVLKVETSTHVGGDKLLGTVKVKSPRLEWQL